MSDIKCPACGARNVEKIDITKYKSDDILTELTDAIKTQLDTDQKENQFFADERRLNTHFQKLVKELQK